MTDDCPASCPVMCGADHMHCPGGTDPNGCPIPDTCMPMEGPIGTDGNACPAACPVTCPPDHMYCGAGSDANGCPMPNTCVPMTDDCPAACPAVCNFATDKTCPGGVDAN